MHDPIDDAPSDTPQPSPPHNAITPAVLNPPGELETNGGVNPGGGPRLPVSALARSVRRACRDGARGHFLTEAAALECVYLVIMSLDPTGSGRKRWTTAGYSIAQLRRSRATRAAA
jgi:hypothetical protein